MFKELEAEVYEAVKRRTAYLPVRGRYYDASERLDWLDEWCRSVNKRSF